MKKSMPLLAQTLALFSFAIAAAAAPLQPAQPPARSEMLVSAQWLSEHLNDPGIVILHVAKDKADYEKGHIPGAHFLPVSRFIDEHVGAMGELPSVEQLKDAFAEAGVSDNSRVILYTTAWFPLAARAFYTLDFLGHDNTALLDGSYDQWTLEKRLVSTETPAFSRGNFTPHLRPAVRALLEEAKAATAASSQAAIVDARPLKRYHDGHLAGAVSIYWLDTLVSKESPVFRPVSELRRLYDSLGIQPGHKVITYCEIGYQASHAYFLAKYLGYDAAMYDGSMYEWQEMQHLPVVKGDAKR